MDHNQLCEWLIKNRGAARVGNPETLKEAEALAKDGYLSKDPQPGEGGLPVFRVTLKGKTYLARWLTIQGKAKMKEIVDAAVSEQAPKVP